MDDEHDPIMTLGKQKSNIPGPTSHPQIKQKDPKPIVMSLIHSKTTFLTSVKPIEMYIRLDTSFKIKKIKKITPSINHKKKCHEFY